MVMYKEEIDRKPSREEIRREIEAQGVLPPTVPYGKIRITKEIKERNAKLRDLEEKRIAGPRDIDDMLKLADVPRPRQQSYNYDEMKASERMEIALRQAQETLEFFKKVLQYCEGNGMKPSFELKSDDLDAEIDKLSEEQLFEIGRLLQFAHDPIDGDVKRKYIKSDKEHDHMRRIKGYCKKRIPAFDERLKLEKLESDIDRQKRILQEKIKEEQRKFEEKRKKESEPVPEPVLEKTEFVKCECGANLKIINESHLQSNRHQEWLREKARKEGEKK